jgi:para-nitrobenzyl esterase
MRAIVETKYGKLRGQVEEGLCVFRGVPYAQAPVGDLRFRPPQPPLPWSGVRDAAAFGPMAPQGGSSLALLGADTGMAEDCLTLNLWTPGLDRPRRPVMVWIHGGAFSSGTGASQLYDGASLARRGDVVVVTLNYRLGALGFLCHPELRDDETGACGNWGLLDQLAALEWIADHIAQFGGDPANVTLFGESAGAASVTILIGTPSAQGLFHRAIAQSGHPAVVSHDRAGRATEELLRELELGPLDFDGLRKLPARAIVEAQGRAAPMPESVRLPYQPSVDGGLLRRTPLEEVHDGLSKGIRLLFGSNRDEWKLFGMSDPERGKLDEAGLVRRLEQRLGGEKASGTPHVAGVIEAYRRARAGRGESVDPWELWMAIESDRQVRLPALRFAEAQAKQESATYCYLFTWESPAASGALGACHGVEIPFALGTLTQPRVSEFVGKGPEAERLSRRMQDAWIAFAYAGDPSHPDLPDWLVYERRRRATMILGRRCRLERAPLEEERAFWEDL